MNLSIKNKNVVFSSSRTSVFKEMAILDIDVVKIVMFSFYLYLFQNLFKAKYFHVFDLEDIEDIDICKELHLVNIEKNIQGATDTCLVENVHVCWYGTSADNNVE